MSGVARGDALAISETLALAQEMAVYDPVVAQVIREATYATLHDDEPIESTARDIAPAALEPGAPS